MGKDHELDVKAESARKQGDEFIKEKKLDVKAADAKKDVDGFMKEHKLDEKANALMLSAETALGMNKNKNSVYPEVIQELEFKLVDRKESGKAAATEDVTTEERKSFVLKYAPSLSN